jgi:hypothetical protein
MESEDVATHNANTGYGKKRAATNECFGIDNPEIVAAPAPKVKLNAECPGVLGLYIRRFRRPLPFGFR